MAQLAVRNLTKRYGLVTAIDDVSFTVRDGEFLTLLGPSGCGKSTTLSALAGLERPDSGEIVLGDRTLFRGEGSIYLPPERRDIGLVFQSYALWPHMSVRQNLEMPLKLRHVGRTERDRRIEEVLALVEMAEYIERFPHELSGGQQQRVALARTLVYQPSLLLLDEPLSNLDAKLRERAQVWLRQLQMKTGLTTVYVTHDQAEALALSDRIAVMNKGRVVQFGEPTEIYERPADPFVADFIGSSNFLGGRIIDKSRQHLSVEFGAGKRLVASSDHDADVGSDVTIAVRPERIDVVAADSTQDNVFSARVEETSYLGAQYLLTVRLDDVLFRLRSTSPVEGQVWLRIPPDACRVFLGRQP